MTTITLPPDLETRLADEASRRGTTPELLAVDSLRKLFASKSIEAGDARNLIEFLGDFVGAAEGTGEPLSEDRDEKFTEALLEKQKRWRGL